MDTDLQYVFRYILCDDVHEIDLTTFSDQLQTNAKC